jgi:hypothetical protein
MGIGGNDVALFSKTAHISPAIRLLNVSAPPMSIDTKTDQVFEWNPAGYADDDMALVTLSAVTQTRSVTTATVGVAVRVAARTGRAVLSAKVLAPLTPAAGSPAATGWLSISISKPEGQQFTVPLKDGEAAPVRFDYSSSEQLAVLIH